MSSRHPADRGELAIVLHSHMPYVEGFGTWPFGEEWLLEAIASSYLPLLRVLEEAAERGGQSVATVGVTPVLADQLAVPELGERFLRFMRGVRRECHRQDGAGLDAAGRHADARSLRRSAGDYEWAADDFERRGGDLLGPLRRLHDAGAIELWTSAATHAVLPMLATEQGVRLQVATGIDAHRASLRRVERRVLAAGVRLPPGDRAAACERRRAGVLRGSDRSWRCSGPARAGCCGRHRRDADRLADDRSWSGTSTAIRPTRHTATITHRP